MKLATLTVVNAPLRIMDANANRAREGLRVMEDVARFALGEAALTKELKRIRHDLADALAPAERLGMILWRDTPGDVGTNIATAAEGHRRGVREMALAAGKRTSEALRAIEECAKVIDNVQAGPFEQLRYRAYEAEKRLMIACGAGCETFQGWMLCVLITEAMCAHHSWVEVAQRAFAGGADCIQLREKELADAEFLQRARRLVDIARRSGDAVIINDRPDIALLADADGVHVGQGDLSAMNARRVVGFDKLVGVSTAHMNDAIAARTAGADYCGVGPMFAGNSKGKDVAGGLNYLREYLDCKPQLPGALAIGGITTENIAELVETAEGKAFGVAVSGAVCAAKDPEAVCARLIEKMAAGRGAVASGAAPE